MFPQIFWNWDIKVFADVPVPENSWEHKPKSLTENMEVLLMYDLMIPSSVNIENKVLRPEIILRYKKKREKKALLSRVLIPLILD